MFYFNKMCLYQSSSILRIFTIFCVPSTANVRKPVFIVTGNIVPCSMNILSIIFHRHNSHTIFTTIINWIFHPVAIAVKSSNPINPSPMTRTVPILLKLPSSNEDLMVAVWHIAQYCSGNKIIGCLVLNACQVATIVPTIRLCL